MSDNFGTSDDFGTGDFGGAAVDLDSMFDMTDVDVSKLDDSPRVSMEGMYHLEIESVKARLSGINDKGEQVARDFQLVCVVLETVKNQSPAGSILIHSLQLCKNDGTVTTFIKESLCRFLIAVGIAEYQEINGQTVVVDKATGTTRIEVSTLEQRLVRRQFLGDVKAEKDDRDETKTYYKFPYNKGIYAVADPRFVNVPKNWEAAKIYGVVKPDVTAQGAGSGASPAMKQADKPTPAKQPPAAQRRTAPAKPATAPATAAAGKGSDDDYADL